MTSFRTTPIRLTAALATLAGVTALLAVDAVPGSAQTTATSVVQLSFDAGTVGQPFPTALANVGDPDITATKVVRNGGDAIVASGRPANGRAADLPAFDGTVTGPRAVFTAVDTDLTDGDALNPGLGRFTFGADFKLDTLSVGDGYDNGNNLIQRGLAGSSDQYKLQVDHTASGYRPYCGLSQQVSGNQTVTAAVTSSVLVTADQWYRARCTRSGSELRLAVTPYAADGTAQPTVTTTRSGIADVDLTWPASPNVPLSIGGKVNLYGAIVNMNDQFNGVVDNAVLTVG